MPVLLPARVAMGWPIRIKEAGDRDGGWTVFSCRDTEAAQRVMRDYPAARMPCWFRFETKSEA